MKTTQETAQGTATKPADTQYAELGIKEVLSSATLAVNAVAGAFIGTRYENTDRNCADDAVQVLFNNILGDDTHVSLRIRNKGKCSVIIGTGTGRGDFSFGGDETQIPNGAHETVRVKVRRGTYLMASCVNSNVCECDWEIDRVQAA